jgi:hypothetical protein
MEFGSSLESNGKEQVEGEKLGKRVGDLKV